MSQAYNPISPTLIESPTIASDLLSVTLQPGAPPFPSLPGNIVTYEDSLPGKLVRQLRHLLDVIDSAGLPLTAGALERLEDLNTDWADLQAELR